VTRSDEQVIEEFGEAVNMSREELEDRLRTGEYKEVGQKNGGESEGTSRAQDRRTTRQK
jgi:hypothetical protein